MNRITQFISKLLPHRSSAKIAKERLQIVVSHQRAENSSTDFLPKLKHELVQVISKYIAIDPEHINVQLQQNGTCSVLELNITLPKAEEMALSLS